MAADQVNEKEKFANDYTKMVVLFVWQGNQVKGNSAQYMLKCLNYKFVQKRFLPHTRFHISQLISNYFPEALRPLLGQVPNRIGALRLRQDGSGPQDPALRPGEPGAKMRVQGRGQRGIRPGVQALGRRWRDSRVQDRDKRGGEL